MFEWDKEKNKKNMDKHGVNFDDAKRIFGGFTVEFEDDRKDYGEQRLCTLGEVNGSILFVVYTRRGNNIRLISARGANSKERKFYYGKFKD